MKKIGVILLSLGVLLIVFGGIYSLVLEVSKEPKFDLASLITKDTYFYNVSDDGFSFMEFIEYNDRYVVQIRKKVFNFNDDNYGSSYYSLQYPIEIKKDEIINKTENFTITYEDSTFHFQSEKVDVGKVFNGDYTQKDIDFNLPSELIDNFFGVYQDSLKDENLLYLLGNRDNYYIQGFIKNLDDEFEFREDIVIEDDEALLERNGIFLEFSDNSVTLTLEDDTKDISFVNGEYQKITKISSKTMSYELNKYILLIPGEFGVII